ncbi:uncharacterized protein BYT42DRAFT_488037, partial [Radiomyces spectabilis]|uniref:uncharacterized protein n=1 Tax=Radiomyces spectabilis TaxID=64574 RepID=UPI00221E973A
VIPFYRKQSKFNTEAVLKAGDYPGHFVVGVIGQQGHGHKTNGIDLYVTSERTILLDTEPIMCWSVLDKALRNGSLDGLHPDIWLEMDVRRIRAEMLKFDIPHFPLIPPSALGQSHPDTNAYPDIVFVANQCHDDDFTWQHYEGAQSVLKHLFADSQLRTKGINTGKIFTKSSINNLNRVTDVDNGYPRSSTACSVESYDVLITALRDQVMAAPRLTGKKGQISEKEWFRNAMKSYELARKSEYISEYLKIVRKLRDG